MLYDKKGLVSNGDVQGRTHAMYSSHQSATALKRKELLFNEGSIGNAQMKRTDDI